MARCRRPGRRCLHKRSPLPRPQDTSNILIGPGGQLSVSSSPDDSNQAPFQQPENQPQLNYPSSSSSSALFTSPSPSTSASPSSSSTWISTTSSISVATSTFVQPSSIVSSSSLMSTIVSSSTLPLSSISTTTVSTSSTASVEVTTLTETQTTSTQVSGSATFTDIASSAANSDSVSSATAVAAVSGGASPSSTNSSSITAHSPPFSIGIALGVIVAVSCICALIAWWVRIRRIRSRRNTSDEVPWADFHSHLNEKVEYPRRIPGLGIQDETGTFMNDRWEHEETGSRRTGLHDNVAHPLPVHSNPYGSQSSDFVSSTSLGPLQVTNLVPGDQSLNSTANCTPNFAQDVPRLSLPHEFGTPRGDNSRPRFLGLGDGLYIPWKQTEPVDHRSLISRDDDIPPLPFPGDTQLNETERGKDGWTASIRSNLVQAFNTVASTLPVATPQPQRQNGDNFTALPSRPGSRIPKPLPRDEKWVTYVGGDMVGKSPSQSYSSSMSHPWSLQETENGKGIVHIHGYNTAIEPQPSIMSDSTMEKPVSRILTHESHAPLVIVKKSQLKLESKGDALRNSSIYSADCSSSSCIPEIPPVSRTSTMSFGSTYGDSCRDTSSGKMSKKKSLKRISSNMSTASEVMTDREQAACLAMKERRRRLKILREARKADC